MPAKKKHVIELMSVLAVYELGLETFETSLMERSDQRMSDLLNEAGYPKASMESLAMATGLTDETHRVMAEAIIARELLMNFIAIVRNVDPCEHHPHQILPSVYLRNVNGVGFVFGQNEGAVAIRMLEAMGSVVIH